ncbi:MAG TPA: serine/threonine-protein kinase [Pyrinomonadaceae bacterium]
MLQESPESFVGRVIDGKYRVEGFIAQGGMGAVYRARHILLGDEVVIKTLRSEMRNNAEWLKRFQREGKAARAFRHPNSVTVYDLSAGSDGMIYMVMEYVEGHTLDHELQRRGRFTPSEALEVLEPVADVLDAAHGRGVVHRDLKPENIMLGSDGRGGTVVKVLDLGIAKIVGAGDVHAAGATSLTMAGQILGTPYYMSPEQWGEMPRDGNPEVDGRTDVYSLGVIFFELVAGKKPLGGRTLSELRQKHVAAPLPLLTEVAPGVPEAFGHAVARSMAKDRADRPQNAGAFVEELRASLGLAPRGRARGIHTTDADSVVTLDASRRREGTHGTGVSGAATANRAHDTTADFADVGRADTILTNEFEATPAGRETDAQGSGHATSGNVGGRRGGGRETVAHGASATRGEDASEFDRRAGEYESQHHGAGVSVTAPEPKRSLAPLVAGGALALLLVAGVGGWLAWRGWGTKPAPAAAAETPQPPQPPPVPRVEAASYWFESFVREKDNRGAHVAEEEPMLDAGTFLRLHFISHGRSGFLYIIAPGEKGNARTTFLTFKGGPSLKSNYVGADAEFSFPNNEQKITLDESAGTDVLNFIFSPTPLESPSFLNGESGHELTAEEIKAWEQFRERYAQDAPELVVRGEGDKRRVVVLAPETATKSKIPLIFEVKVKRTNRP